MAVDFSKLLYTPVQDTFARRVEITPIASQPGAPAYSARGRFSTKELEVMAANGAVINDRQTILEIRDAEFSVLPAQLDRIQIPADASIGPALGVFEVNDVFSNDIGKSKLLLRRVV